MRQLVLLLLLCIIFHFCNGFPSELKSENLQTMKFFSKDDYSGDEETFTANVPHVQNSTVVGKVAKSFCIVSGVWAIKVNVTFGNEAPSSCPAFLVETMVVSSNLGLVCFSFDNPETGQKATYHAIKHLAHNDLSSPSISLFSGSWIGQELGLTGNSVRLLEPSTFDAIAITGDQPWTVFEGQDFNGPSICLPFGETANNPFLIGVNFKDDVQLEKVGSAKVGCDDAKDDKRIGSVKVLRTESNGITFPSEEMKNCVEARVKI